MATGFTRSSDRPRGRQVAARQLEEFMLAGAPTARDWDQPPARYEGRDRGIDELIDEYGGTKSLAEATGRSQRQVQRWRRDGTDHITTSSRAALDKANQSLNNQARREQGRREWGELADRFGGANGLANAVGVDRSTVQRWMSGQSLPSEPNLGKLRRADRGYQLSQSYSHLNVDPKTGSPQGRVHMKAAGMVHAQGPEGSPLYQYARQIGVDSLSDLGHELPPDVAGDMFDAMHRGDTTGALDVLQEHMSGAREDDPWSYANCGAYSVEDDLGFFIDDFTEFTLN